LSIIISSPPTFIDSFNIGDYCALGETQFVILLGFIIVFCDCGPPLPGLLVDLFSLLFVNWFRVLGFVGGGKRDGRNVCCIMFLEFDVIRGE
jgi:hypothetical protein